MESQLQLFEPVAAVWEEAVSTWLSVNVLIFLFLAGGLPTQGNSFKPCLAFSLLRLFLLVKRKRREKDRYLCMFPLRSLSFHSLGT